MPSVKDLNKLPQYESLYFHIFMVSPKTQQPNLPTKIFWVLHKMLLFNAISVAAVDNTKPCTYTQMRTSTSPDVGFYFIIGRLRFTFTPNGKREFVPRDQVFFVLVVYCLLLLLKNKYFHASFIHKNCSGQFLFSYFLF